MLQISPPRSRAPGIPVAGEHAHVPGPSGSGKSTLLTLSTPIRHTLDSIVAAGRMIILKSLPIRHHAGAGNMIAMT